MCDTLDVGPDTRPGPRHGRSPPAQGPFERTRPLSERPGPRFHGRRLRPIGVTPCEVEVVVTVRRPVDQTGKDLLRVRRVGLLVVHVRTRPRALQPEQERLDRVVLVVGPRTVPVDAVGETPVGETLDQVRTLTPVERTDPFLIAPTSTGHGFDLIVEPLIHLLKETLSSTNGCLGLVQGPTVEVTLLDDTRGPLLTREILKPNVLLIVERPETDVGRETGSTIGPELRGQPDGYMSSKGPET